MSGTHIESSITEKMRQVRAPSVPIKQVEKINLAAYKEAIRPSNVEISKSIKVDLAKLLANK